MHTRPLILPVALFLLPPSGLTQTLTFLVKEGDTVAGVGLVTSITNLAVNNSGLWLVEADTDAVTTADSVVLRGGVLFLREDDPLAPPPATLSSADGFSINAAGDVGWNLFLRNLTTTTDSGIYFNTTLVIQEGTISTAPQFSANTIYTGWFDARINDNNQILMLSSVDDPAITGTTNRALVIATVNGAGSLLSEAVIVKQGDLLPGITVETVADIGTGVHDIAFNNLGSAIFSADLTGLAANDGAVVIGGTGGLVVVAREGDPSPIAGRNYETILARSVDINDAGDWVLNSNLDGATTDDEVIIKNGSQLIAQEGTGVPAIGAFTFTNFGTGAVQIDDSGDVFWFGDWNDPNTARDMGLFRNSELLVQEGVTTVNGMLIEALLSGQDNFSISPDGRFLVFETTLQSGINAVVQLDLSGPVPVPYCFGDGSGTACPCAHGAGGNGCASSVNAAGGNLAASGGASISNDTLLLSGSGMPNSSALYFQGTTPLNGGFGTVFGDGLRCVGGSIVRLKTVTNVGGASSIPQAGDPSLSVKGLVTAPGTRTYQVWYRNASVYCNPETFNLTNGVLVTWVL